jgi:biopolymer transport protein ExbD
MRVPVRAWIGIVALVGSFALYAFAQMSLAPRQKVALDLPVRIASGRFSSGPFVIRDDEYEGYVEEIVFARAPRMMPRECDPDGVLNTMWTESANGIARSGRAGPAAYNSALSIDYLSPKFEGHDEPVHYTLDLNFEPGAECLDAFAPRLKIHTEPYPSDAYVFTTWLAEMFIVLSVAMIVVLPAQEWVARHDDAFAPRRMLPEMPMRQVMAWRPQRAIARPSAVPVQFGPMFSMVLLALAAITMPDSMRHEQGLALDIDTKQVARASDSPWRETMSVYVTARGEFVVNGAPVAKRELKNRVAAELNRRTSWLVYVEADDSVEFSEVAYAMDTIEGLGAQVFWITPAVRKEWDVGETPSGTKSKC